MMGTEIESVYREGTASVEPFFYSKNLKEFTEKLVYIPYFVLAVPDEWLEIIQKEAGSWKKEIFYNTGVTALFTNEGKMLRKMQDVFRVFKENRKEVDLLWRHHPLIKATIESMSPKLWEEYEKLVEDYREEGRGIYDDTADMNRALALCGTYYGDNSSIVQLCQEAGKPTMI